MEAAVNAARVKVLNIYLVAHGFKASGRGDVAPRMDIVALRGWIRDLGPLLVVWSRGQGGDCPDVRCPNLNCPPVTCGSCVCPAGTGSATLLVVTFVAGAALGALCATVFWKLSASKPVLAAGTTESDNQGSSAPGEARRRAQARLHALRDS